MALITKKGIEGPPKYLLEEHQELYQWLSQLQLRFPKISTYSESINLASINATSYSTQTFTVTGLTTEDIIIVNPPSLSAGLYLISYRVSATDTLSLTLYNSTGAPIDEAAATYLIMACKV